MHKACAPPRSWSYPGAALTVSGVVRVLRTDTRACPRGSGLGKRQMCCSPDRTLLSAFPVQPLARDTPSSAALTLHALARMGLMLYGRARRVVS